MACLVRDDSVISALEHNYFLGQTAHSSNALIRFKNYPNLYSHDKKNNYVEGICSCLSHSSHFVNIFFTFLIFLTSKYQLKPILIKAKGINGI